MPVQTIHGTRWTKAERRALSDAVLAFMANYAATAPAIVNSENLAHDLIVDPTRGVDLAKVVRRTVVDRIEQFRTYRAPIRGLPRIDANYVEQALDQLIELQDALERFIRDYDV